MPIETSPYELIARADGRRRAGVLLRVTFEDGVRGYADLHPWPERGDAPLNRQLAALANGTPEPLASRSLALARVDGEARAENRSLFEGLTVPPSHASLPFGHTAEDLARAEKAGCRIAKLKTWTLGAEDLARLRDSALRFRIDFNAALAYTEIERWLNGLGDLGWIDWLEDPCPFDAQSWRALQNRVRVAIDFEIGDAGYDVRVVKPAREATPVGGDPIAFTSYLDHPVGQLGAAWAAATACAEGKSVETGGLATHEVYLPDAFSRCLGVREARLIPPVGTGLGFDRELERLEWTELKP